MRRSLALPLAAGVVLTAPPAVSAAAGPGRAAARSLAYLKRRFFHGLPAAVPVMGDPAVPAVIVLPPEIDITNAS